MPAYINIQPTLHTNQRNRLRLRCTSGRNVKQNPTKTDSEKRKLLDKTCAKRYSCTMAMCAQISLQIRSNPLAEDTARWLICTEQPSTTSKHKSFLPHGTAVKGLFASKRSTSRFVTRKKQFASYFVAAYARVRDFLQINFCQAAG